jgi:hypothetical protein
MELQSFRRGKRKIHCKAVLDGSLKVKYASVVKQDWLHSAASSFYLATFAHQT